MKVFRAEEKDVKRLEYGDVVPFDMSDGEHCEAIVIAIEGDNAICTLVDALKNWHRMNPTSTTNGGYLATEMRKYLNSELLDRFPTELREQMVADDNGDYLRLFTEKEVFGKNIYADEEESEDVKQYDYFKFRRNRIALNGWNSDYPEWWWLSNPASATYFCYCNTGGRANRGVASYALYYVRPRFVIKVEQ